jgi:hypothetical protein
MEPINIIIDALAGAIAAGAIKITGSTIQSLYSKIKERILEKFSSEVEAGKAFDDFEKDPDKEREKIQDLIKQADAQQDKLLIKDAKSLLKLLGEIQKNSTNYSQVIKNQGNVKTQINISSINSLKLNMNDNDEIKK